MKKCSVCGALIGDADLYCLSCHSNNIYIERPDTSYYPFQKNILNCATKEKMGPALAVDSFLIGLLFVLSFIL